MWQLGGILVTIRLHQTVIPPDRTVRRTISEDWEMRIPIHFRIELPDGMNQQPVEQSRHQAGERRDGCPADRHAASQGFVSRQRRDSPEVVLRSIRMSKETGGKAQKAQQFPPQPT